MINEKVVRKIMSELYKEGYDCFVSEAQLRDAFAIKLKEMLPNCIVLPEYSEPKPIGWRCSENIIHFDLLIKDNDDNETVLVEFKYKQRRGNFKNRNGIFAQLSNHSDTTNGRYAIWRDIYRIETFCDLKKINKGFVVFITNNLAYLAKPNPGSVAEEFSIADGNHIAASKNWNLTSARRSSIHDTYWLDDKPLIIKNDYYFSYSDYSRVLDEMAHPHIFKQLILPIHSADFKDELMRLINGVGMRVFVEHYDEFASKIATLSGEGFTSKAVKSRIGKANAIFNRHLETDALRAIINSTKTEQVIRDKALAILNRTE